ncbi:MAG: T9SS type A sorting domain-containing protein, partial [Taibaiella sp.]|nr:T9SS type A sorting domain-containing protein [Taibaiella sp.]
TSDKGASWCSGKENIFRSANTNGGTQPWYQWKINGVDIGPGADTLWVPYLNDGDVIECDMASSAKCPLPDTVSSNKINMTILPTTKSSIIIMPNPDSIICRDEEVTMYCAFTNGGTTPAFQWMLNGKDIPGETMGTFKTESLNNGDIINCRFISSGICVFPEVSNPVSFVVNPEVHPEVSITVLYIGNNQHLFTALPVNGGANPVYRWYLNGRQLKDEQGNTVTLAALTRADKVWVEMASSECVAANMRLVSSKKITTGIEENHTTFKTLNLHPNPNKGIFVVEGDIALANVQEVNMTILNSIGQVIYHEQAPVLSGKLNYTVTTKDLPPGGYLLKLDYDGGQDFRRFVIVR